jgi:hypothetical protein
MSDLDAAKNSYTLIIAGIGNVKIILLHANNYTQGVFLQSGSGRGFFADQSNQAG